MVEEQVVLVNERDKAVGVEGKIRAHLLGTLHRAFSVFVVNAAGQLLVQRRALTKYHSRGSSRTPVAVIIGRASPSKRPRDEDSKRRWGSTHI